jgi:hypothetical protein
MTALGRPYQVLSTYVTRDDVQAAEASFEEPPTAATFEAPEVATSLEEARAPVSVVGAAVEAESASDDGERAGDGETGESDGSAGDADRTGSDGEAPVVMPAEPLPDGHGRERKTARAGKPEREFSARFLAVTAEREDGTATSEFDLYEDIYFRVRYRVMKPLHLFQVVLVVRAGFEHVLQTYDTDDESVIADHPVGVFERRVKVDRFFLKEGRYAITLQCGTQAELIDSQVDALRFDIVCRQEDANMEYRSYRRDRPGKVIFHGAWLGDREPLP